MEEIEPNNTASEADKNLSLCEDEWVAGKLPNGDSNDIYWIHVDRDGTLVVNLKDIPPGTDYDLFVYNEQKQQIGESRRFGTAPEEVKISVHPGKYYLRVYAYAGHSDQNYHLMWALKG